MAEILETLTITELTQMLATFNVTKLAEILTILDNPWVPETIESIETISTIMICALVTSVIIMIVSLLTYISQYILIVQPSSKQHPKSGVISGDEQCDLEMGCSPMSWLELTRAFRACDDRTSQPIIKRRRKLILKLLGNAPCDTPGLEKLLVDIIKNDGIVKDTDVWLKIKAMRLAMKFRYNSSELRCAVTDALGHSVGVIRLVASSFENTIF